MTYQRQPSTVEDALKRALDQLPPVVIFAYTGLQDLSPLQKASNPAVNKHLAFQYGPALDAALISQGLPPVFEPLFKRMRDNILRNNGAKVPTDIEDRFLSIMSETGALCGDYRQARDPNSEAGAGLGNTERARMEARCCRMIETLTALVNDLREGDEQPHLQVVNSQC